MILLDSSFIIAFYNTSDKNHQRAKDLMKSIINKEYGDLYISDYIFDESATGMLKPIGLVATFRICDAILDGAYLIYTDENSFKKSFEMFKRQKGTMLSFTDCSSIVLMNSKGIKNLAAFDSDFKHISHINLVN